MDNHFTTKITNDKVQLMNNIDLNALFHLNYNFDLLKGVIEELLKNQEILQNHMDKINSSNDDKDRRIAELEREVKILKENQIDKNLIEQIQNDLSEIKSHLKKHDDQIDDLYSKIKEITNKLDSFDSKINNLSVNNNNNEKEITFDSSNLEKSIKDLWDEIQKLKFNLNNTNENVKNNKEKIESIFPRLEDIIKGYKEGDDNLQKQIDALKQYIDDKIKELQSQLDLFINTPSKGGSEVGNKDLKAIQDLIKRLSQLEISFKEFVNKARIDDLWNEIDKLKTNKADISYVDDKYNDLLNQINNILNKINELNEKDNEQQEEIDDLRKKLDDIYTLVQTLQNQLNNFHPITHDTEIGKPNIDLSQYVSLILFNDYKKENNEKFSKIFAELDKLKKLIDELFELLKNKADLNDLEDLKNFLLQKIDELAIACNKKFADKNETAKNFRYLEQQIKKILAMLLNKKDDHGDNWLLAKKPLNGFTCASCEAYIGELKDNGQYIPWNRYPLRDPNEKLYRIGNGFSKMLQMLNFDNVDSSNSPPKGNQTSTNFFKANNVNVNPNLNNDSNNSDNKGRFQSAYYRNKNVNNLQQNSNIQGNNSIEENSKINNNAHKDNLPKIKKKNINDGFDSSIGDAGNEDDGPKIMKVFKKGKK